MTFLSTFQHLLVEHEDDLQRIRKTYFPLLEERVITGYNLYLDPPEVSDGPYTLQYFHSDLGEDDKHFQELSRLLDTRVEKRVSLEHTLIDPHHILERMASYLTQANWKNSPFMKYFNFDGTEITYEKALSIRKEGFIGEVLQYTLGIPATDEKELRYLLDFFKEFTSAFLLDSYGRKKISVLGQEQLNPSAITSSWSLPLLVCSTKTNKKPKSLRDFLAVHSFTIYPVLGRGHLYLQLLIRKKSEEFGVFLRKNFFSYTSDKKYALRAFVEDYLDV